jgi:EAL domain-containing protein (putative c-di-GMP-specific phosphodiesterase class I)
MVQGACSAAGSPGRLLILARDPSVLAAAHGAARRLGRSAIVLQSPDEAIRHIQEAPEGSAGFQLICEPAAAEAAWARLLATTAEPANRSALLIVTGAAAQGPRLPLGLRSLPADPARLTAALAMGVCGHTGQALPRCAGVALGAALRRGEMAVHYQPVVRIADRRLVMVEALVRWQMQHPPISPQHFVALAEAAGLAEALAVAVVSRATEEVGAMRRRPRFGVAVNMPLEVVLRPHLPEHLRRAVASSRLRPADIAIELTETTPVRDRTALRRGLQRLRAAGHPVLLDDVLQDDPRTALFDLPFTGIKLDRSLVEALPHRARAREQVRRLAQGARRRAQRVVGEGVAEPHLLRLLRDLGVGFAQGYTIGRPVPAAAMPGWFASWRAGRGASHGRGPRSHGAAAVA